MKVQDLVEKLLKIDPELDVFVSPLIDMPIGTLGKQDPDRPMEIGRSSIRFEISGSKRRPDQNDGSASKRHRIVIGYDQENPHVENTEENSGRESIH
jgi:hypothetical protein